MGTAVAAPVRLSVRRGDEVVVEDLEWPLVPLTLLGEARPWRTFRWFKGQQYYSGMYWSATVGDHVIYESRLELGGCCPPTSLRTCGTSLPSLFCSRPLSMARGHETLVVGGRRA